MSYDPNGRARLIELAPRTGSLYILPAWGYLEGIEIRYVDPIANMDTGQPHEMLIERLPPGFQVYLKVRDVPDPRLG